MNGEILAMIVRLCTGVNVSEVKGWTGAPCIFFANHASNLDALVIWAAMPREIRENTSPVAARDYWTKTRLRNWIASKVFKAILLDRKGRPKDRSHPLQAISDELEKGRSIIIFPEGTRSLNGQLQQFKPGLHHLHHSHPQCTLIPVSLQNLNRILPKGQSLPVPLIGRITVHSPLEIIVGENREDFLARARSAVAVGLQKNNTDE
ncbi:MAG: 1-acyl-sn-glycerol-3-phosphate acyltransferase [Armatimonadetes bacterium]|nr:1-acyl-sn-glycerol-3-phosphate acyltransferase [Akkermansiaceae bacterium]